MFGAKNVQTVSHQAMSRTVHSSYSYLQYEKSGGVPSLQFHKERSKNAFRVVVRAGAEKPGIKTKPLAPYGNSKKGSLRSTAQA